MHIEHIAIWTMDLERMRAFYERHFGAVAGPRYDSTNTPGFQSYFLTFPWGGARVEVMRAAAHAARYERPAPGYAHFAVSVGSKAAVDDFAARLHADGVRVRAAPRQTGDGYYEAVIEDPDGNPIEITV